MKRICLVLLALSMSYCLSAYVYGGPSPTPQPRQPTLPVYKPPVRGAPLIRVGAGTRTVGNIPLLQALAPEHVGWTSRRQPTLYWYIANPPTQVLEVAIASEDEVEPLLETTLTLFQGSGIHPFDLSQYGIHLRPNIEYQWTVSLVRDGRRRSLDIISTGWILWVPESKLPATDDLLAVNAYAAKGYWYDAFDLAYRLATDAGADRSSVLACRSLLEQVSMPDLPKRVCSSK